MRIATTLLAPCALLLGIGAAAAADTLTPNCAKGCTVVVTMSAGCGSGIKVAPDPVVVPAGATVDISWEIVGEGWAFEGPGIFIHQAGSAFEGAPGSSKKRGFKNKNTQPRAYKYDVILKDVRPGSGGGVCKLDPTVVNQ